MDEFLKLYLTGKRADDLKRSRTLQSLVALFGATFAFIPMFLTIFGKESVPVNLTLTIIGFVLEVAAVFLVPLRKRFIVGLVELENSAIEIEKTGEEREAYRKLYEAWRETFGRQTSMEALTVAIGVLGYAILAVSVLLATFMKLPDVVLPLACMAAGAVMAIPAWLKAVSEGKMRASLYEKAGKELDEIKRIRFGVSERKIMAESENARGVSMLPVPVAMFLKDDAEREEFRTVNKRSGVVSMLFGVAIVVAIALASFSSIWEKVGPIVTWTVVLVAFVLFGVIFFVLVLPLEGKKRSIYQRNYNKLTDSRADTLRRDLQGAWIRQQRRGNIMFLCFLLAPLVFGIVYGTIGYILYHEQFLIAAIGASFLAFLIPAAFVSLIVWMVMYAVYRRKVRPTEAELKIAIEEERGNERQG